MKAPAFPYRTRHGRAFGGRRVGLSGRVDKDGATSLVDLCRRKVLLFWPFRVINTSPERKTRTEYAGRTETSMEQRKYYLAYGSNLNIRQMRTRCPEARIVGTAVIPDCQLLFKGSGTGAYLTIERKTGAAVPVGVWSVTAEDEAALDVYEGFPTFYYKTEMTVTVKDIQSGKTSRRKAFVYIMHEDRKLGLPSSRYVQTCAAGYRDFGFDEKILTDAVNESAMRSER